MYFKFPVIAALLASAVICVSCTDSSRLPNKSTDINALGESMPEILWFKDGDIYNRNGGETLKLAESAYDADNDSPVYTADYAIDKNSDKIVYVSENALYYFDGKKRVKIAENVKSWRTNSDMRTIVFTLPWSESGTETESLFIYRNGETVHCGTGFSDITLTESCVYALKQNVYPHVRYTLYRFDFDGNRELINSNVPKIMWASDSTVLCGESADGTLYTYYAIKRNKCTVINDVYYASVTDGGSTLYAIADYDTVIASGKLISLSLDGFSQRVLAENVHFFSTDAVTEPDKGIVYSVCTDKEKGRYSVYYCTLNGKSVRLLHNTSADAMYNIAINSENGTGWLLSKGAQPGDGAIYRIKLNRTLETERVATGDFASLVYYGLTDSVTFAESPESGDGHLYIADDSGVRLLASNCVSERDASGYRAQCVLSRGGNKLMYFSSLASDGSIFSGRLCVTPDTVIAENVASGYTVAPVTYGELDEIYYLVPSNGRYDLYFYSGGSTELIETGVDGLLQK